MLDVNLSSQISPLAQWVTRVIAQPGMRLKVKYRNQQLHIVCEAKQAPAAPEIIAKLQANLAEPAQVNSLHQLCDRPLEKINIYGLQIGQDHPIWTHEIALDQMEAYSPTEQITEILQPLVPQVQLVVAADLTVGESIARTQHLQLTSQSATDNPDIPNSASQRLWVNCHCPKKIPPVEIVPPLIQKLRQLNLDRYRDVVFCAYLEGRNRPFWVIRGNLTPNWQMLQDWGRWGDVEAIALLLNLALAQRQISFRVIGKDETLHLFSSTAGGLPPQQTEVMTVVAPLLQKVAPQGLHAATIYGVATHDNQEIPAWVQWLDLPASRASSLAKDTTSLARSGDEGAIAFLLQRLVNPHLEQYLTTGGIEVLVKRRAELLDVVVAAPLCPEPAQVVKPIRRAIAKLKIPGITGIRLYGRQTGKQQPSWKEGYDFQQKQVVTPPPLVIPVTPAPRPVVRPPAPEDAIAPWRELCCHTGLVVEKTAQELDAKVALVWGALGIMLVCQTDWLLGLVAKRLQPEQPLQTRSQRTPTQAEQILQRAGISPNPSFNSTLIDNKLLLYQHRIKLQGRPPDVLIVGSSRALRGIDPLVLRESLAAQGYGQIDVFNFGINGATAQVVDLLLRRMLRADQLPKLVIWADGVRALNSGREDVTYNLLTKTEGYRAIATGQFPPGIATPAPPQTADPEKLNQQLNDWLGGISQGYTHRQDLEKAVRQLLAKPKSDQFQTVPEAPVNEEAIDADGFLALPVQFDPQTYYQRYAKVSGEYDKDYQDFRFEGDQDQALRQLTGHLAKQGTRLVFINLPLTNYYLDPTRSRYEQRFEQYLWERSTQQGFTVRNLNQLWLKQYNYFSDPNHLNRYGAEALAKLIAADRVIGWPLNQ